MQIKCKVKGNNFEKFDCNRTTCWYFQWFSLIVAEPTPARVLSLDPVPRGPHRQRVPIPEAREYLLPRFLLPHFLGFDESPRMPPPPQRTVPDHDWLNKVSTVLACIKRCHLLRNKSHSTREVINCPSPTTPTPLYQQSREHIYERWRMHQHKNKSLSKYVSLSYLVSAN